MPMGDRNVLAVGGETGGPEAVAKSKPETHRLRNSAQIEAVDWEVAVRAAGNLLAETFGPTGSASSPVAADDPVVIEMARDVAARLCAYDEIEKTVEHMQTRMPIRSED